MSDSIAERMDAGWQAARYWEAECEAARAERDALRGQVEERTRQIIEARQQRADVIHERDTLKGRVRELDQYANGAAALHQELEDARDECDELAAQLAALKKRVADAPHATGFLREDGGVEVFYGNGNKRSIGQARIALLRLKDGE